MHQALTKNKFDKLETILIFAHYSQNPTIRLFLLENLNEIFCHILLKA